MPRKSRINLYQSISRSHLLGSIAKSLRIQTNRIGKVGSFFSGTDQGELTNKKIGYNLIRNSPAVERTLPYTLKDQSQQVFAESSYCEKTDYYLLSISNAYVMSHRGWVLTKNRDVLIESLYRPDIHDSKGISDIVIWPKPEPVHKKLFSANKPWIVKNYYHWVLEFLPKISVFVNPPNETFTELLRDAKILLPFYPSGWMEQSLSMIGITENQIYVAPREHLKVDQLLFTPNYGKLYNLPLWAIEWLRERFSSYMQATGGKRRRIYISRRKAATRRVQNEDIVLQMLSTYGFEEILLEDMNLADQIALFSQAEIVVGPHGAGFSNMVFSNSATLIDIFEPNHVNSCFYNLCYDSGQLYWYLMAETVDGVNMHVDVDKLERTLIAALKQRDLP